jgi:hypothetical protein
MPAAAIEKKIASIWSPIRFTPRTLDGIETRAIADFDLLLDEQEKLATEQRTRLIQLERQKTTLIEADMADALPVEDLKLRQKQLATEIADARRLIAESDIERTKLRNRLQTVLALLPKPARPTTPPLARLANCSTRRCSSASKSIAVTLVRQATARRPKSHSSRTPSSPRSWTHVGLPPRRHHCYRSDR